MNELNSIPKLHRNWDAVFCLDTYIVLKIILPLIFSINFLELSDLSARKGYVFIGMTGLI